jgi:pyruvate/2-oxoglutarate dehydrogenase complex dihydrolipoamide acyltransferase (E2) component
MTEVLFPELSAKDPDTEGVVATWFVRNGDHVAADQLIAEVQVDKVSAEVPSPTAGTVELLVDEGESVVQSTPIARVR